MVSRPEGQVAFEVPEGRFHFDHLQIECRTSNPGGIPRAPFGSAEWIAVTEHVGSSAILRYPADQRNSEKFPAESGRADAPAANRLPHEASAFLDWFEAAEGIDRALKAGIAHFWFVTLHPSEDGSGRINRAIADLTLAEGRISEVLFGLIMVLTFIGSLSVAVANGTEIRTMLIGALGGNLWHLSCGLR